MEYYKCNRVGMFIFLIDITKVKALYYRQKDHTYKSKSYKMQILINSPLF